MNLKLSTNESASSFDWLSTHSSTFIFEPSSHKLNDLTLETFVENSDDSDGSFVLTFTST